MAEVALIKNAAEQQLAAEWAAAKAKLPGAAPLRAAAFERFAKTGLPHRRVEEWKYTDLRALMRDAKPLALPPDAGAKARAKDAGGLLAHVESRKLVFADGALVVIEKGARVMLVESHEGAAGRDYQVNTALELSVADEAHVDHVKITREADKALHLSSLMADVGAHARFNTFLFTIGGAVVRNQLFLRFGGESTIANIRGASLLKNRQHADTTLVVDHAVAGCQSHEVFKSVLDDESRGIFQGKIIVRPGAQKTDAKMASHALMLSEEAEADNKPELEIFADDVQCGHGATAGDLDEDLLFYLRARGIPAAEAEALLIQAFVGDAIEGIEHAGLREALMEAVDAWLKARG